MFFLLLTAMVVPWPSSIRPEPALKPSWRVRGTSSAPIVGLAYSGIGGTLATTDESGRATLWQASASEILPLNFEFPGRARIVAFSFDGRLMAVGGDGSQVALYDLARPGLKLYRQLPGRSTRQLSFSPDGRTLAIASFDSPDILVWDLVAGCARRVLKGHRAPVMHLAFAAAGQSLASAAGTSDDRPILIWDLAAESPRRRIPVSGSALQALAYSVDGNLVAGACPHEKSVRIWDVRTGEQVVTLAGHSQPTRSIAFSPDGHLLATGAGDGTAAIWNIATGTELVRLDCEAEVVHNVAFSADGHTLAATANDGDIRLWALADPIEERLYP